MSDYDYEHSNNQDDQPRSPIFKTRAQQIIPTSVTSETDVYHDIQYRRMSPVQQFSTSGNVLPENQPNENVTTTPSTIADLPSTDVQSLYVEKSKLGPVDSECFQWREFQNNHYDDVKRRIMQMIATKSNLNTSDTKLSFSPSTIKDLPSASICSIHLEQEDLRPIEDSEAFMYVRRKKQAKTPRKTSPYSPSSLLPNQSSNGVIANTKTLEFIPNTKLATSGPRAKGNSQYSKTGTAATTQNLVQYTPKAIEVVKQINLMERSTSKRMLAMSKQFFNVKRDRLNSSSVLKQLTTSQPFNQRLSQVKGSKVVNTSAISMTKNAKNESKQSKSMLKKLKGISRKKGKTVTDSGLRSSSPGLKTGDDRQAEVDMVWNRIHTTANNDTDNDSYDSNNDNNLNNNNNNHNINSDYHIRSTEDSDSNESSTTNTTTTTNRIKNKNRTTANKTIESNFRAKTKKSPIKKRLMKSPRNTSTTINSTTTNTQTNKPSTSKTPVKTVTHSLHTRKHHTITGKTHKSVPKDIKKQLRITSKVFQPPSQYSQ